VATETGPNSGRVVQGVIAALVIIVLGYLVWSSQSGAPGEEAAHAETASSESAPAADAAQSVEATQPSAETPAPELTVEPNASKRCCTRRRYRLCPYNCRSGCPYLRYGSDRG
jgi:zona occludens toxin (predicted ATPase)